MACGPGGGCDVVTSSRFATAAGVPIAAIGLGYYVLVSLLAWTPAASWGRGTAALFLALTAAAAGISAVLVYLQAAVIDAWCRFCLLSAAITAALFLCAIALYRRGRSGSREAETTLERRGSRVGADPRDGA